MENQTYSSYKYVILVSAFLLQLCLGATYAWSIFVEPLKLFLSKSQAEIQLPFTVFYTFFPCTMLFTGYAIDRFGMRIVAVLGALLFSLAWISTGLFGNDICIIVLFIGIIGGIGVGLAYVIPIKACMQWFPKHKGLATGFAVAGFGGGSALISQIGRHLMDIEKLHPLTVFKLFGLTFLILGTICAFLMKSPDGKNQTQKTDIHFPSVIKDKMFWYLFFGMLAGLAGGFAIIPNLKQVYHQATAFMGATAVTLFACANASGRVIWGAIHDKFGGKKIIIANLISQAVVLSLGSFFISNSLIYYLFALWAGFNYGGVLVLYASEGGTIWGPAKIPKIYGWIFFANVPGALAPLFAGFIYDQSASFSTAFALLAVYLVLTASFLVVKYPQKISREPVVS